MALYGEMIQVESGDGFMVDCYFAEATGAAKGGLVAIMEAFGVNDHMKQICDGYAGQGYDAIAPALYDRIERNFDSGYAFDSAIKNDGGFLVAYRGWARDAYAEQARQLRETSDLVVDGSRPLDELAAQVAEAASARAG